MKHIKGPLVQNTQMYETGGALKLKTLAGRFPIVYSTQRCESIFIQFIPFMSSSCKHIVEILTKIHGKAVL